MAIIKVKNLTKEYQLGQLESIKDSIKNSVLRLMGKETVERKRFKAIENIGFSVEEGEVIGIIGTNGAGKSTLLKMISGITTPTSGSVNVKGKIAPLIEVGAGLVPDLTGRENIFLNATILGMKRKEIEKKFDEIVEFSELEDFIDTPIKRYSSGMAIRLGFAIATSIDADILIVDEVLAVGDLAFQRKCFDRMEASIKHQGKTVLIVSHNIRQVERLCTRVMLMDHGRIIDSGNPKDICELFYRQSNAKIAQQAAELYKSGKNLRMTGEIELSNLKLLDEQGNECSEISNGDAITIQGTFSSKEVIENAEIVYGFHTTDMVYIASMGTAHLESKAKVHRGINIISCKMASLPLVAGTYAIRVCVLDKYRREMFYGETLIIFSVQPKDIPISKTAVLGLIDIPASWEFVN